jgi:hypothetical protein
MVVLVIILGIVLFGLTLIVVGGSIKNKNRKSRCKAWKVGDKLILTRGNKYYDELQKNNRDYAILEGWSLDNLYINCGSGYVSKVEWSVLNLNKSAYWRMNYEEAKKVMGFEPNFSFEIDENVKISGKKYDGKPIETLTEIECEVYLKKVLEEEDYVTADLIRKRMEKFR